MPKAYLIANIEVKDPAMFERYRAAVPAVIAAHGGRYLIRGGEATVVEGKNPFARLVVLEFPDRAALERFWASDDYRRIVGLRIDATTSDVVFVDGVAG